MLNNPEKDKDISILLDEIKLELLSYINKKIQLFKLSTFEKLSLSASLIGYGLIIACIMAVFLFFSLFGLGFFIGQLLNNQAAGFGALALSSLLVLGIVVLCRKWIVRFLLNKAILFVRKIDEANEA